MWRYLKQVLIAFDQLVNALLGGWADESLSAHAWRQHLEGKRDWPYQLIDTYRRPRQGIPGVSPEDRPPQGV